VNTVFVYSNSIFSTLLFLIMHIMNIYPVIAVCDNCLFDWIIPVLVSDCRRPCHAPPASIDLCPVLLLCILLLSSASIVSYRLWMVFLVVFCPYILPKCVHSLHAGFVPVRCVQSIVTFMSFWLSLALTHCISVLSNWFSILSCSGLSQKLWVCFGILSFNSPNLTAIRAYWPHWGLQESQFDGDIKCSELHRAVKAVLEPSKLFLPL